jgi:hypothetical protein
MAGWEQSKTAADDRSSIVNTTIALEPMVYSIEENGRRTYKLS